MSSRVLRKLQGEKDLNEEISDNEIDAPISSGARRKQLNLNRYDLVSEFKALLFICHTLPGYINEIIWDSINQKLIFIN